jgi:hypothetical protein
MLAYATRSSCTRDDSDDVGLLQHVALVLLCGLHDFLDGGDQVVVLEIGGGLDLTVLLYPEDLELLLHHDALLVRLLLHGGE